MSSIKETTLDIPARMLVRPTESFEIETISIAEGVSRIEACLLYCERNELMLSELAKRLSKSMKAKLFQEAIDMGAVRPSLIDEDNFVGIDGFFD
jgi:hypothetical protein